MTQNPSLPLRGGLRCGVTTGTCAALAAGAAASLLAGERPALASLTTPGGLTVTAEVLDARLEDGTAACAVRKDAGDDPDVTGGVLVYAGVRLSQEPGVRIEGGPGVGRVTLPGLDQPVGAAAINRVPRRMIAEAVQSALQKGGLPPGEVVWASVRQNNEKSGVEKPGKVSYNSKPMRPRQAEQPPRRNRRRSQWRKK